MKTFLITDTKSRKQWVAHRTEEEIAPRFQRMQIGEIWPLHEGQSIYPSVDGPRYEIQRES